MKSKCPSFNKVAGLAGAASAAGAIAAGVLLLSRLPAFVSVLAGALTFFCVFVAFEAVFVRPGIRSCKSAFEKLVVQKRIFDASNEAIIVTSKENLITDANQAFTNITGYSKEEALGMDPGFMKSGRHDKDFYKSMWADINQRGEWQGEVWDRRKNGEIYPKWLTIQTLKDPAGGVNGYLGIFSDLSAMKETEQLHEFMIHYDPLTHLPNRALFSERLRQAMRNAVSERQKVAVVMVDIDRFKSINDMMGHASGDEILKESARRIKSCARKSDTVARIGDDEFALVLTGVTSSNIPSAVAKKIMKAMEAPVRARHTEIKVTVSMGVSVFPTDAEKPHQLLKNSETALDHAKKDGHSNLKFFTDEMKTEAKERLRIESNLREALDRNELVLHYQPQVDLLTGDITGMEALIRRQESDWLVPPGVFIPVAEETGLIMEIADWTLREACSQVMKWRKDGINPPRVAINISAMHFNSPGFVRGIGNVLSSSGLEPELLEIELTERVIMHNADEVTRKIRELKEMGICLSIDDFGTGYSSLSYLKRFEVDKLKVDYSFVKDIAEDTNSGGAKIVKAIISLSHNLGFTVIAEGVEKPEQMKFLREEGCDEAQGFLFSFPLPADKCAEVLRKGRITQGFEPSKPGEPLF